jgi:hypothetical protein
MFRPNTSITTGISFFAVEHSSGGVSIAQHTQWVNTDYAGDFDLYTSAAVNGVSIFITGAQMK